MLPIVGALGIVLNAAGVLVLASDLFSGRKGRLIDMHNSLAELLWAYENSLSMQRGLEQKFTDMGVPFPEEYAIDHKAWNADWERRVLDRRTQIDKLTQESREKGFRMEMLGIVLIVGGSLFQLAGLADE